MTKKEEKEKMPLSYFGVLRPVILDAIESFCDCRGITQNEAFEIVREYLHRQPKPKL